MSTILPAEFFGLPGIGAAISQAAQSLEAARQQQQRESYQQLSLLQALDPNNREKLIQNAIQMGLVKPEEIQYTPTAMEAFRAGTPFEALNPQQQLEIGGQLGLKPGETPTTATRMRGLEVRGAELGVRSSELGVQEQEAAAQERVDYNQAINSNASLREMMGVAEGETITPGTLRAHQISQGLTSQSLEQAILRAKARYADATELAQLNALLAQTRQTEAQTAALQRQMAAEGGDTLTAQWVGDVSKATGLTPTEIQAVLAYSPEQVARLNPQQRAAYDHASSTLSSYRTALATDLQKQIREGRASGAINFMADLQAMEEKRLIDVPDQVYAGLFERGAAESGLPLQFIAGKKKWWGGEGTPQVSFREQAAALTGNTAEKPRLNPENAANFASAMVTQFGSVAAARAQLEKATTIPDPDKRMILDDLARREREAAPATAPMTGVQSGSGSSASAPPARAPARPPAVTGREAPPPRQVQQPMSWDDVRQHASTLSESYARKHPGRQHTVSINLAKIDRLTALQAQAQANINAVRERSGIEPASMVENVQRYDRQIKALQRKVEEEVRRSR